MKTKLIKKISPSEILQVELSINDNDNTNNGYEYISIYGRLFVRNGHRTEEKIVFEGKLYYYDGILGEELILKHFPKLEPIIKVNGCDLFGFDSYPLGNTQYHCIHSPEYAEKKYRLTKEEVKLFADLNYTGLAKRMYKISKERYANEINEAVKIIEELTGEKHQQKEKISHQLYNDIVYYITSEIPEKQRGWNLINGTYPEKYPIDLDN